MTRWARAGAALLASAAISLSACGGSSKSTSNAHDTSRTETVDVYSSLPLHGVSATHGRAIVAGIRLALGQLHGRAGQWRVRYFSLDDSSRTAGSWDLSRTVANAHRAASDPGAVYYIGEFDSAASEISIPILNQAGIAQVSPASTYVGLTTSDPGSAGDEPQRYYPTSGRTFLRIIPRDTAQAAAGLLAMKQAGCTRVAIAFDQDRYGAGLAELLQAQKGYYGLKVVLSAAIDPTVSGYRSFSLLARDRGANCFFFAGVASDAAVEVTREVHLAIPSARIFGGDGVCTGSYTNGNLGGVGIAIDPLVECTRLPEKLSAYSGGKSFLAAYRARYRTTTPDPYAIYGYEAMKLGLATIAALGPQANSKAAVLDALYAISGRRSVLGTYRFNDNGDTTLKSYGLYGVGSSGNPAFLRTITPGRVL
jgi:branched-chain amino acid transport system substrate-binding protein